MKKFEAIRKVNAMSNFSLKSGSTRFANICTTKHNGKSIWWVDVPKEKFSRGFYFLFCYLNDTLILLKIPPNALNLKLLYYRQDSNKYSFYVCSNKGDTLYMHDLLGTGEVDLTEFIVDCFD